ncbi:MAG TPA: DUF4426 domain-containing protein [Porticoccaceae bacterium]|nr:DUF4426 domain-containing protein [Porticoccaceae bacterium]
MQQVTLRWSWLGLLLTLLLPLAARADDRPFREFGEYRVHYSAFNSSFIDAKIAAAYDIVRGGDRGLVNIAVVPTGSVGGRPAQVSGHVANIFGQRQTLEFFEVREGDVAYYLAPFRFEHEDVLTFNVTVKPAQDLPSYDLSFRRTFYRDR